MDNAWISLWFVVFWVSFSILTYTYIGYPLLLWMAAWLRRTFSPHVLPLPEAGALPEITLLVAAYNEATIIEAKIHDCLALRYPEEKFHILFITDGSDDGTPEIVARYPYIRLMHQPERRGKTAAIRRAMEQIDTPVVVFTDANTFLNPDALRLIVRHYEDPQVGAVAGEKCIISQTDADASAAGEGLYWRYESALKRWDSELYSVVGAAGELFSIRTAHYEALPEDTLLDDFMLSLHIAAKGYRVRYEPEAQAFETASPSIRDELKRRVRIAAGGLQAIARLGNLLNPFQHGLLTWQYLSHRVMRWTLAPAALPFLFFSNWIYSWQGHYHYWWTLYAQVVFYLLAAAGFFLQRKKVGIKGFFVPYYFCVMNFAVYAGLIKLLRGEQTVLWERVQRVEEVDV